MLLSGSQRADGPPRSGAKAGLQVAADRVANVAGTAALRRGPLHTQTSATGPESLRRVGRGIGGARLIKNEKSGEGQPQMSLPAPSGGRGAIKHHSRAPV